MNVAPGYIQHTYLLKHDASGMHYSHNQHIVSCLLLCPLIMSAELGILELLSILEEPTFHV